MHAFVLPRTTYCQDSFCPTLSVHAGGRRPSSTRNCSESGQLAQEAQETASKFGPFNLPVEITEPTDKH